MHAAILYLNAFSRHTRNSNLHVIKIINTFRFKLNNKNACFWEKSYFGSIFKKGVEIRVRLSNGMKANSLVYNP